MATIFYQNLSITVKVGVFLADVKALQNLLQLGVVGNDVPKKRATNTNGIEGLIPAELAKTFMVISPSDIFKIILESY